MIAEYVIAFGAFVFPRTSKPDPVKSKFAVFSIQFNVSFKLIDVPSSM